MLHHNRFNAPQECTWQTLIRPDYRTLGFAQIPSAVEILLGIRRQDDHPFGSILHRYLHPEIKNVILLLIDGFGYHQLKRYSKCPFIERLEKRGDIVPISTLFPSTTAASVTTINSGLTPQEHGLMEWRLYMEEVDGIVVTLPFHLYGDSRNNSLTKIGVSPEILFSGESLHTRLHNRGMKTHSILHHSYAESPYSKISQKHSDIVEYVDASDMVVQLRERLKNNRSSAYFYVYYDILDQMCHRYGPHSDAHRASINGLMHLLKTELLDKADRRAAEKTVLIVTADHGHVRMDSNTTIYLNQCPDLDDAFAVSPVSGKPILPWGSPRDVFMKVKEDRVDETIASLHRFLDGRAAVLKSQEEADNGLFGIGTEHAQFRSRIGNILIVPYEDETVWYMHPGFDRMIRRGMHGGMSPEEMTTYFGIARLSDLL